MLCLGLFEVVSRCGLRGLSFKVHRLRAPVPGLTSCTRFVVLAALLLVACLVRRLLGWSVCLVAQPFPVSRLAGSGSLSSCHRDPAGESISRVALSCLVCCVICCIICFLVSGCIVCCIVVLSSCCLLCAGFLVVSCRCGCSGVSLQVQRLRAPALRPHLKTRTRFVGLAVLLLVACLVRWLIGWSVCLAVCQVDWLSRARNLA